MPESGMANAHGSMVETLKPRILMVISLFYPCMGGAEQQALNLAAGLVAKGFSVSVLTRRLKNLPHVERIKGVAIHRDILTLPWGKWFGVSYMLSTFWFLYKKRNTYDIIHCHLAQGFHTPVAIFFKKFFNKRVIIKIGATGPISDFIMLKDTLPGGYFLKKIRFADCLIAVCSQARQEALKEGFASESVVEIPNGVDIYQFKPSSAKNKSDEIITFAGRLDRMKGVHILIEAFKKLRKQRASSRLQIIGTGPDEGILRALAENLALGNTVTFTGESDNIAEHLQQSTIFVLPSFSEGLSNVLLEAMACGLPVIATRVGGNTDIIQDGTNGLLVEPNSAEELSAAIMRILSDREFAEKLGRQARKTVEECFSMDSVLARYQKLYGEIFSHSA